MFEVQACHGGQTWQQVDQATTEVDARDAVSAYLRAERVPVRIMAEQDGVRVQLGVWGPQPAAPIAAGPTPTLR